MATLSGTVDFLAVNTWMTRSIAPDSMKNNIKKKNAPWKDMKISDRPIPGAAHDM
jgi:hypothetical protein